MARFMHIISYLSFAPAEGNPCLGCLFWEIYDRLATFTQMGAYSLSLAERGVALAQEKFPTVNVSVACAALLPCFMVSSNRFCGWHAVTLPHARRFSSAWSPTLQPFSSSAPYWRPSNWHIIAIADARDLVNNTLTKNFT
jgi:hypothetical protein